MKPDLGPSVPFGTFAPNLLQRTLMHLGRLIPDVPYRRKMARPLRWALKRISKTPIDVTVFGKQRMRLHLEGNSCEKRLLVIPHLFDHHELAMLSQALYPGSTFIDIGANVGIYSIFAALQAGPDAKIIAVEPHPLALERLRCNIVLNDLTNIVVEELALSGLNGSIHLSTVDRNFGRSSIVFDDTARDKSVIEVKTDTLFGICDKHGLASLDAVKLDVEGAEDRILCPFFQAAPRKLWPRLLIVEDSQRDWHDDIQELLLQKGYRRKHIPRRNMVFWR
ncbi:MAG: FkbM family methyltransferase [Alphaproteobacteria bacterium]|nr:FkbM family methyltransferase [Alphaproteobacteria bacterium]